MDEKETVTRILQDPEQINVIRILVLVSVAWALIILIDRLIPWVAERVSGRVRLYLLPSVPVLRLFIVLVAAGFLIPMVIETNLQNVVLILGAAGLAIGFAFKDYVSSVIAGALAIYERTYRPGDWVEIDGAYGEVRSLSLRALRILTLDDTIVTIPHAKIWDTNIYNANDGERELQCVVDFYLEPSHDAALVRQVLCDVALTSSYLQVERPVAVVVAEKPWGTHYRLKAYPIEGREQAQFTSDLTVRGKAALAERGVQPAIAAAVAQGE